MGSKPDQLDQLELRDAQKVEQALELLQNGNLPWADRLLQEVAANAPEEYAYSYSRDDRVYIKFWTEEEFLNYIIWQLSHGIDQHVVWIPSAYPRAYYYLGLIRVATGNCEEAIQLLREGRALEPSNPKFLVEEAQANIPLGHFWAAVELLNEVNELGPHTGAHDLGIALRAKGFVLTELDELDLAEEVYAQSLEYDPDSELALNQLRYIEHVRRGGNGAPVQLLGYRSRDILKCCRCGAVVTEGAVASVRGRIVGDCSGCGGHRQ